MKEHILRFTTEEFDAVMPQICSRLDELEKQLCEAGKNNNPARVVELSKFIETIKSFQQKMYNAY